MPNRGNPGSATLVIATGVAVAVIVLALLLSGMFPGLSTSSSSGGGSPSGTSSERSAQAVASTYAGGIPGGPWSLSAAAGIDTTVGVNDTASSIALGNASCPLSGTTITNIVIPGFNGTYSGGFAEAWLMAFYSSAGTGAVLYLVVQNGVVGEIGVVSGPGCVSGTLATPLPNGLIDSTEAASAAVATTNGSRYVAAHPHSNATYSLAVYSNGAGSVGVPAWDVQFDSCSGGNYSEFSAGIYAANGTIAGSLYSSTASPLCSASTSTPLGTVFAWGTPINASGTTETGCPVAAGHFCYAIEIAGAGNGVSTSNVELSLQTPTGATIPWPASLTSVSLISPTGPVVATYSATNNSWTLNGTFSGEFASGMTIEIYTTGGPGLLGDQLVASGEQGYSGTVPSNAFS